MQKVVKPHIEGQGAEEGKSGRGSSEREAKAQPW